MPKPHESSTDYRVLVLAPVGRDSELTCSVLTASGVYCEACPDANDFISRLKLGAGSAILTEESFTPWLLEELREVLSRQPPWSDIQLIVSTFEDPGTQSCTATLQSIEAFHNVTFLERPLRIMTLVSIVRTALSSRKRQYQMRDSIVREIAGRLEAERLNRLKDEFLTTLSHELRTPLNVIIGFSHLLAAERPGSTTFVEAVAAINRSAKVQAELVNDILDVSGIIAGKFKLKVDTIDLASIVQETVDSFSLALRAKRLRLTTQIERIDSTTSGDRTRLQQVIWNIVANAIKFTPAGGSIEVKLSRQGESLILKFGDDGEGITEEFLPFIFDRFRQEDGTFARKHGGLGIGLAITHHIVEMHGGTIAAQSGGRGQGSTFTVTLPVLSKLDDRQDSFVGARAKQFFDLNGNVGDSESVSVTALIVDDQQDSRGLASAFLKRAGFRTQEASSTKQAMAALESGIFDLLLCDIGMPEEDGISFLKRLRESGCQSRGIPAIALTGYASALDKERVLNAGFDAYLSKPVLPNDLYATAKKVLSKTDASRLQLPRVPGSNVNSGITANT